MARTIKKTLFRRSSQIAFCIKGMRKPTIFSLFVAIYERKDYEKRKENLNGENNNKK